MPPKGAERQERAAEQNVTADYRMQVKGGLRPDQRKRPGTSQPWPLPDLVVGSPTVTDSTLTSGQSFQLSLGYRSQPGLGPWAAATTLRYYGSTTSTIARREEQQPSDPRIGKPAASFGR